ncbi:MAG: helix-turn-helix domain-containing protein [Candidatus Diapherotrites archaeon]
MTEFLDVPSREQRRILLLFKNKLNLTWNELAKIMGINKSTLFFYCSDAIRAPIYRILKLCELTGVPVKELGKLKTTFIKYGKRLQIRKPPMDSVQLAELCGVLLGDGCIYSKNNGLCISGHQIHDYKYFTEKISPMFENLFMQKPSIYKSRNSKSLRLVLYSKEVAEFLSSSIFVVGNKKKAKARIPEYYFNNPELLIACLRGLSDTDGSICPHPHTKVMYSITIKIPDLLNSTIEAYRKIGFPVKVSGYNIYFYGEKLLSRFFSEIGSSNPKHVIKWQQFKKTGKMPRSTESEQMLKNQLYRN